MTAGWTAADQAELDLLTQALVDLEFEHREQCDACRPGDCPSLMAWRQHLNECPACRGDAPLTYGSPCARKAEFVAHSCVRCEPCRSKREAIETVLDWRARRSAASFAAGMRARQTAIDAEEAPA